MRTLALSLLTCVLAASASAATRVDGELRRWHRITLTFDGPQSSEDAAPNPFREFRLSVKFTHVSSGEIRTVPGYFAADGNAGESGAKGGNKWRAHFAPPQTGQWRYEAVMRAGPDVATFDDPQAGQAVPIEGAAGTFNVQASNKRDRDFRGKGFLQYAAGHHLRFAQSGEYYLKGGADSPENFLAYAEFDDTFDADARSGSYNEVGTFIHKYEPHVRDWRRGDPTWRGGKGKGIIGALNYLASKGMNSVYFLTYNLDGGDGRDTWMWTSPEVRDRFDTSKLDQWEIVFTHMDRLGIMLHVVTQETENDRRLGGSPGLNPVRKLYYRELAARFSHHPALIWNLGEENNTPDEDRKAIARYLRTQDTYQHPVTVHTKNGKALTFYDGILGDPYFEATSIQGRMEDTYNETVALRKRTAGKGRKWVIFHDEQNPASHGVLPDADDPAHDVPRIHALWGNLMAGGSGVEWYFGSKFPHMDINCEDWRSRETMWDQTRYALEFFHKHLPFWEMEPVDGPARVLAKGDQIYAIHLPAGGTAAVTLSSAAYRVRWYNPRTGAFTGSANTLKGPGERTIGPAPSDPGKDWIALLDR